ncbi:MAG: 30S ribosomal protein S16 [Patescibacteria group bacterium]
MLSIRLSRVGKKKAPIYRVVVMPKTRDPWAKTTQNLGNWNPRTKALTVKPEEVQQWIKNGAECSDTVWNIFIDQKIVEGKKRNVTHISGKRKGIMEKMVTEKKAKEDAAKAKAEAAKIAEEEAKKAAAEKPVETKE